ncbi:MAG: hypothetical protein A3G60_00345 [Candidatus Ryanbacteria bacterium RIFCSPLOWO2_12_FULL_47_9c]|uniref:Peptidase S1 domain-containing protein n=2 Tax=Candidatus Ryaniibacteriota TaxID=1817914 RepID=A0A1G2H678_9BACT|nr:MAG: hypothetical protein A3G60_00345 [Candidatus Ryanbacteria bacterium RIFCSPLOWO2_12_FULL_47_9c]
MTTFLFILPLYHSNVILAPMRQIYTLALILIITSTVIILFSVVHRTEPDSYIFQNKPLDPPLQMRGIDNNETLNLEENMSNEKRVKEEVNNGVRNITPQIADHIKVRVQLENTQNPATTPAQNPIPQSDVYNKGLRTVVSLLCPKDSDEIIIGTGAIISKDGYILSTAHITDEIKNTPTCTVRRGAPAETFGEASLVFIPRAYKAATSSEDRALYDFSLWKINDKEIFDSWELEYKTISARDEVLLTLTYPAELLSSRIIFNNLYPLFSTTHTISTNEYFIRSRSSLSAQQGSSGGILIDPFTGKIRAIIFGVSQNNIISERILFSLTPHAIDEALFQETGLHLTEYLGSFP